MILFIYSEYGINLSQLGTVGFNKTLNRKYLRIGLDAPSVVSSHFVIRLPVTVEEVSEFGLHRTCELSPKLSK